MKKLFILLTLILLSVACSKDIKETKFNTHSFNESKLINPYKEINFEKFAYNSLVSLNKNFNLAKLVDSEYNFAILDDDLNLKQKIIKKDEARGFPNQFDFISAEIINEDQLKLIINDFQAEKIMEFRVELKNSNQNVRKINELFYDNAGNIVELIETEQGEYITNCSNIDSNMDYIRKYSDEFELIDKIPLHYTTESQELSFLWYNFNSTFTNSLTQIKPDTFLVSVPKIKELILIDSDLSIIKKIKTPFSDSEIEEIINNRSKFYYFDEPFVTKENIILPYNQRNQENSKKNKATLLIYDHYLQPKKSINLNHNLSKVSVSKDESLLFVIDFEEEKTYIYNFNDLELNN